MKNSSSKRSNKPLGALRLFLKTSMMLFILWEDSFNNIPDSHCPWREKRVKQKAPASWITMELIKHFYTRDNLLKVARSSYSADDWANYRIARNKAVSVLLSR